MNSFEFLFPIDIFTAPVWVSIAFFAIGKPLLGLVWEAVTRAHASAGHRIFRIGIPADQRSRELKSSWHVISDAIVFWALLRLGLLRLAPETLPRALLTFCMLYVWVETWYYFTHRLMHESAFLYRFHRSHHLSRVVTPLSSISMSWVEKWIFYSLGWLGFMALVSRIMPVSLYGIAAYYLFHFIISLHGHSNVETSRLGALASRTFGFGSATSHALHHARYRFNYGFSCMLIDKLLGTFSGDTETLQGNAIAKAGAESFK